MAKVFSIYRSSAGSGKTRTLARAYLKLALQYRADYFKHILAVTFTNKASQEMKDRILSYLDDFSKGKENELATELKAELGLDDQTFQQHSQATQSAILHQYAQFSISTIDAFFQKVIRSFTRESGLIGDYRLEVDHEAVLEAVIDNLIDELGSNKELTDWVVEFAKENLENERAWDVRYSLIAFSREIFREEFKEIEDEVLDKTKHNSFFKDLLNTLRKKRYLFINTIKAKALEALALIQEHGLTAADFKYAGGGVYSFFKKASEISQVKEFGEKEKGKRPETDYQKTDNWPGKRTQHATLILQLAETQLIPLMNDILRCWQNNYEVSLSAEVALNSLYAFGLIADIARKLKEYKDENNLMLLADAPKFLNGVIRDSDTPFIYEKVGSFYRNYLIDEFQDTSGLQWRNFQPLVINSLDQGYTGLVVGDVKQAIYRWRGGDLKLLQHEIAAHVGEYRLEIKTLDKNYRSASHVVNFNNAIFRSAAAIIASETGASVPAEAYTDVAQQFSKAEEGFVHIQFLKTQEPYDGDEKTDDGGTAQSNSKWTTQALDRLPITLEELQLKGVPLKDIAILVRKNEEGQRIAAHLLHYKNSGKARAGCSYDVVSSESLRVDGASSVNLLLGAMRYLLNAEDVVARAQLGYEFAKIHEPDRDLPSVFSVAHQAIFESNLPKAFVDQKKFLKKLPLIELTETLIGIFQLGKVQGELVYLQAFQDLVLDFYNRERNDLGAFLDWWEDNRHKKSVQLSGDVNAVQILTVHKSKGLQFPYVIIPFCAWSLDHDNWQAPNLWVKSDKPPFSDAGYLPVKYSKMLEQTWFSSYYHEEHTRTYLDNLNLLYVAFTRAEQGMIITAPHPETRGAKDSVAGLLYRSIQASDDMKNNWNESEDIFKCGECTAQQSIQPSLSGYVALSTYISSPWRDKLLIRQSGAAYFRDIETAQRKKINYGIHMHAILSRMRYADEVDATLDQIVFEGLITENEKPALRNEMTALLEMPEVASWFSKTWAVLTEVPILLPGGNQNRIDRLIYRDKKAVVIDFKTGQKKKDDSRQVVEYVGLLHQMNFTSVEGYLLYLAEREIVEVKPGGKQKIVKRNKNTDQLSLGFE